jgi:hypothetical protein
MPNTRFEVIVQETIYRRIIIDDPENTQGGFPQGFKEAGETAAQAGSGTVVDTSYTGIIATPVNSADAEPVDYTIGS